MARIRSFAGSVLDVLVTISVHLGITQIPDK